MKATTTAFGVLFYLKTQKTTTQGLAPICARVTVNGKRTEISVKRSVNANEWDERKGIAKGTRKEKLGLTCSLASSRQRSLILISRWFSVTRR